MEEQRVELQQLCSKNEEELNDETLLYYACKYDKTELAVELFNAFLTDELEEYLEDAGDEYKKGEFLSNIGLGKNGVLPNTPIEWKRFMYCLNNNTFLYICRNNNIVLANSFIDNLESLCDICYLNTRNLITPNFCELDSDMFEPKYVDLSYKMSKETDNNRVFNERMCETGLPIMCYHFYMYHYLGEYIDYMNEYCKLCIERDNVEILKRIYQMFDRYIKIEGWGLFNTKEIQALEGMWSFSEVWRYLKNNSKGPYLKSLNLKWGVITKETITFARSCKSNKVLEFFKTHLNEKADRKRDLLKLEMKRYEEKQKKTDEHILKYNELIEQCENWNSRRNLILNRQSFRNQNGLGK